MTRDTVWQDDPPFAVGNKCTCGNTEVFQVHSWDCASRNPSEPHIAPATDEQIAYLAENAELEFGVGLCANWVHGLIARIKAERERFQALRDNYKCGDEYEAGLWSRRNIEAFFRDQEGKS
jgi:hypothetical protein